MDQTAFYQTTEDLNAINPDLAKLTTLETSGKWVLLVEACNFAAKVARDKFQEERDIFKAANPTVKQNPPEVKKWDDMSSRLMKSAKNLLLPHAIENGAQAFSSSDDAGQPVLLLRHEDVGMIAIHGVNLEKMDNPIVRENVIPAGDDTQFTGFRRQRLSALLAKAATTNGITDPVVQSIREASINPDFAAAVQNELGGKEAVPNLPDDKIVASLVTHYKNG